jgi:hypothetical protein
MKKLIMRRETFCPLELQPRIIVGRAVEPGLTVMTYEDRCTQDID